MEAHHHILLQHLAANLVLLAQAALATHLRPYDLDENTAWIDGLVKQKGHGRHSGRDRKDRGGLILHRCACRSLVGGNKSNGRGRCNGLCSLRNGRRHMRLLLALVGALGEVDALGDSDGGGGYFVPGACTATTASMARAGAALYSATARAGAARS